MVLYLIILFLCASVGATEYNCDHEQDHTADSLPSNDAMTGIYNTSSSCTKACVHLKQSDGQINFMTYKNQTGECFCRKNVKSLKKSTGFQSCFLVPDVPGTDPISYKCKFRESRSGKGTEKHFIGIRNHRVMCRVSCAERRILYPYINAVSYHPDTMQCYCIRKMTKTLTVAKSQNCYLEKKYRRCRRKYVQHGDKQYLRCMRIASNSVKEFNTSSYLVIVTAISYCIITQMVQ